MAAHINLCPPLSLFNLHLECQSPSGFFYLPFKAFTRQKACGQDDPALGSRPGLRPLSSPLEHMPWDQPAAGHPALRGVFLLTSRRVHIPCVDTGCLSEPRYPGLWDTLLKAILLLVPGYLLPLLRTSPGEFPIRRPNTFQMNPMLASQTRIVKECHSGQVAGLGLTSPRENSLAPRKGCAQLIQQNLPKSSHAAF